MTAKYYQRTVPAVATPAIAAGAVVFDASKANSFVVAVTTAITSATITNPLQYQIITISYVVAGGYGYVWPTIAFQNGQTPANQGYGRVDSVTLFYDPNTAAWQEISRSNAVNPYVQSRGENLVTNGSGLLGSNYNFTGFAFSQNEVHGGAGSFLLGSQAQVVSDEMIPVNPDKFYRLNVWAKSGQAGGANYQAVNNQYMGIACFDIDGFAVDPWYYAKASGSTDTTLAVTLVPGATTITLTNATGWYVGATGYQRNLAWYGYTNSKGFTYPDWTYTRNTTVGQSDFAANGAWAAAGITGNVITLRTPWAGPTIPSGTAVRNITSGSTFKYICIAGTAVPNTWTNYEGVVGTIDTLGVMDANKFPYGTAFVKLLFLNNWQGGTANNIRWSDLWLSEMSSRNLEPASATAPGVVSTAAQSFAGAKTFATGLISSTYVQSPNLQDPTALLPYLAMGASIVALNRTTASQIPLIARGMALQSGDLQQWQDSTAAVLASVNNAGNFVCAGVNSSGIVQAPYFVFNGNTGPYFTMSATGILLLNRTTAANVPLTVRGMAAQTGNLQEWQSSTPTALAYITATGILKISTIGDASGALILTQGSLERVRVQNTGTRFLSQAVGDNPITVQGVLGQTGNLQEWRSSTAAVLAAMSAAGVLTAAALATAGAVYSGVLSDPTALLPYISLGSGSVNIINRTTASQVPLTVRGMASQTGDLQQWQDSTAAVLAKITAAGTLQILSITDVNNVGPYFAFTSAAALVGNRTDVTNVPLAVRGMAGQTGDLQQWQDSSGAVFARATIAGLLSGVSIGATGKNSLSPRTFVGRSGTTGAPTTGTWVVDDEVLDSAGTSWRCTVAGTPGTWVQASAASGGAAPSFFAMAKWGTD